MLKQWPRTTQHLTLEQVQFVAGEFAEHLTQFPVLVNTETHLRRADEFVVLGMEDPAHGDACYFTRRANKQGEQFWGNYRMTLEEAYADFQERRES